MDSPKKQNGKQLLVEQLTYRFELENINYYSFNDFLKAKRKYLKFMLSGGEIVSLSESRSLYC